MAEVSKAADPVAEMMDEQLVDAFYEEAEGVGRMIADKLEEGEGSQMAGYDPEDSLIRAELLRRLGASGVPPLVIESIEWQAIIDALLFTGEHAGLVSDAHVSVLPKVEKIRNGFAKASGVDVEAIARVCAEFVALRQPSYLRDKEVAILAPALAAEIRKHIAQPADPALPKGFMDEPKWSTDPHNASYNAGKRDAVKVFHEWRAAIAKAAPPQEKDNG